MKVFIFFIIYFFLSFKVFAFNWLKETIDTSNTAYTSIAVDRSNFIHIAYACDEGLKYATNKNGCWETEIVDEVDARYPSIVVDENGCVHIAYRDDDIDQIKYAVRTQNGWNIEDIPIDGEYITMAIDGEGNAHISCCKNGCLIYITNKNGSWDSTNIICYSSYPHLALDRDGFAHIAFKRTLYDSNSYTAYLCYATNKSGDWEIEALLTTTDPNTAFYDPSVAIDNQGNVHITSVKGTFLHSYLLYGTNASGTWRFSTIAEGYEAVSSRMVIDKDGFIHIVANIVSTTTEDFFKYITNRSGTWESYIIENAYAHCPSIAIDSNDFIHISYGLAGLKYVTTNVPKPYIQELSPDPNPQKSRVMKGGVTYRYYKVFNGSGDPLSNASVNISCGEKNMVFTSDDHGILTIQLKADELGNVGDEITCLITHINGEEINPVGFSMEIIPRESFVSFKVGRGINIGAAIVTGVRLGDKRGLIYKIMSSDAEIGDGNDKIELERFMDLEASLFEKVGAGVELGNCSAKPFDLELGAKFVGSISNKYYFPNPYTTEEYIPRSALILLSLYQDLNPFRYPNPLESFILESLASMLSLREYLKGISVSGGIGVHGDLYVGKRFNVGNNNLFSIEIGSGIKGDANILFQYFLDYGRVDTLNSSGSGVKASFFGGLNLSTEMGIGAIGQKVGLELGGNYAWEYDLILYATPDAGITKGEIVLAGRKDWGVNLNGSISTSDAGSTPVFVIELTKEQLEEVANDILEIIKLSNYLNNHQEDTIQLGPTRIKEVLNKLFNRLRNMCFSYRVEVEKGRAYSLNPSFSLSAGASFDFGVELTLEKSLSYVKERGSICNDRIYVISSYQDDEYIPDLDSISFMEFLRDAGNTAYSYLKDVGKISTEVTKNVGDFVISGIKYATSWLFRSYVKSPETKPFGIGGIFTFSPEGLEIGEISRGISEEEKILVDNAILTIKPGVDKGILEITYSEEEVNGIDEDEIRLFLWDSNNRRWNVVSRCETQSDLRKLACEITKLGTYTLGIPLPQGNIKLIVEPSDVDLDNPQIITVTSGTIYKMDGEPVADGTLFTVSVVKNYSSSRENFGTIISQDGSPEIDGIQVRSNGGIISFQIEPPLEVGAGLIVVSSVQGTAFGKSEFNVVQNLDLDGDSLPDYWEKEYFNSIDVEPSDDPDNDGLANLEEYNFQTNPSSNDTDQDGMPDGWELENNLNPRFDDATRDLDSDGFVNLYEYQMGTDPESSDSAPIYRDIAKLVPLDYDVRGVATKDNYAFTLDRYGSLCIFDISDILDLTSYKAYSPSICYYDGNDKGLLRYGNFLYTYGSDIAVYDISNPSSPRYRRSIYLLSPAINALIAGRYLIVGENGYLEIFNLDDPSSPSVISTLSLDEVAWSLAYYKNYLYVSSYDLTSGDSYLYIINLANPSSPSIHKKIHLDYLPYHIKVVNKYLITSGTYYLSIWDLEDTSNPLLMNQVSTKGRVCAKDGRYIINNGKVFKIEGSSIMPYQLFNTYYDEQRSGFPYGSYVEYRNGKSLIFLSQFLGALVIRGEKSMNRQPTISEIKVTASDNPLHINFTCDASDSDGVIQSYIWDFDGDGSPDLVDILPSASYIYSVGGTRQVTCTVVDDNGCSSSHTITIEIKPKIGDVNDDNRVDIIDALLIARHSAGLHDENFDASSADANCDGSIDIIDALLVAKHSAGLDMAGTGWCGE